MEFDEFWIAFKVPVEYTNRYRACSHLWEEQAASRRQEMMDDLSKHAAAGTETAQRNPYYYIKDFQVRTVTKPSRTPTNYNGRALPTDQAVVSARYDSRWGTYTIQDARDFRMLIRIPEAIFLHGRPLYEAQNEGKHLVQVARPQTNDRYLYEETKPDPRRIYMCTKEDADLYQLQILVDPWAKD